MSICTNPQTVPPARRPPARPFEAVPAARARRERAEPAPAPLLVVTYDAALRYMDAAETAYGRGVPEAGAGNVRKAQRILVELMGALDRAFAPEITDALARVCQALLDRLSEAVAGRDALLVADARHTLEAVRAAWLNTGRARPLSRPVCVVPGQGRTTAPARP